MPPPTPAYPGQGWPTFHGNLASPPPMVGLKSRRYVFYDRERVWGPNRDTLFFVDNRRTADGRNKDATFTNMTQSGQLGTPLSIQVAYLSIYPVAGDDAYLAEYDRFAKSHSVFEWIMGGNTKFTERPLALMPVRSVEERLYRDRITNKLCYVIVEDGQLRVVPLEAAKEAPLEGIFADRGSPRYLDVTTPGKKARYIDSAESFRARITNSHPYPDAKDIDVYVCMEGMLLSPHM